MGMMVHFALDSASEDNFDDSSSVSIDDFIQGKSVPRL